VNRKQKGRAELGDPLGSLGAF